MACLLKMPSQKSKGVLVFTTQERDNLILKNSHFASSIAGLKNRWMIGLHHNWHDFNFRYNPLFDFSMAGETDLVEQTGKRIPLLPMDACNFVPPCFSPSVNSEKFWDILYVARAVYFKKIPEFFDCVKKLYDRGFEYRVLFLCPVPPYKLSDRKTGFYNIRDEYDRRFNESEKDRFNLITMDYRYPFPFDLPTLAHFYRSSRIFVHFADDERRCRVAAYAWTSGIPVVGMTCVGSLIETETRQPPYYYEVKDYADFPEQIVKALNAKSDDFGSVAKQLAQSSSIQQLQRHLKALAHEQGCELDDLGYYFSNLDIRLGRHLGLGAGPNHVNVDFGSFLKTLGNESFKDLMESTSQDPERSLEKKLPPTTISLLSRVLKSC